jgi:hypothetical protein
MAGHIVSIIGGKGGVGKSQLAANLAIAWATEIRQKVLLLDFDQKACGDQNIITGLRSKKNIKELDIIGFLNKNKGKFTIFQPAGFEMASLKFPHTKDQLYTVCKKGLFHDNQSKKIIFSPISITEFMSCVFMTVVMLYSSVIS